MDREAQKAGQSSSGVKGIAMQDASLQESMGEVCDRSRENLVSTDNAIIMARNVLYKSAMGLDDGKRPPGLDEDTQAVRSASFVLPRDMTFSEAPDEPMKVKKGIAHTSM